MSPPVLRLYPARFRREFGDEIAEAYREATEGAGPLTRFREGFDIAAHALRLRLGLGSAQRGGRLFAAAAPFALAGTAAEAAFNLVSTLSDWRISGNPDFLVPLSYVTGGCYLAALIGAVLALCGRFTGALWALAGMAGVLTCFLTVLPARALLLPWEFTAVLLAPVVFAAVPLACPPDLRPPRRIGGAPGIAAVALWAPLCVALFALLDSAEIWSGSFFHLRYVVPVAAALALAGRSAWSGIRTAGQFTLAAAPFLGTGFLAGVLDDTTLLPALAVTAVAGLTVRSWRRRNSGTATPT
ncbi:hypothetical protein [Streptomyces sp. NBC_01565]|uniref:hypothetical protein n=1 Tax=Streptomyces sp. NBC_01565 TaxID=2975881 RepID=UPI0022508C18|nr:hypothetical protein [Streptomyces sp. NBC_01565]MCX4539831.1 hypothetical protein [Streptomyces sp. NBC_01565]